MSYAQSLGMIVTAYSPLGNGRSYAALGHSDVVAIEEDVVVKIANRLNVTPAQVVLRWGVQRGCAVIPKSENETHIKANLDIAGFALSDEDMEAIKELEKVTTNVPVRGGPTKSVARGRGKRKLINSKNNGGGMPRIKPLSQSYLLL